jgi:hypothetical protein
MNKKTIFLMVLTVFSIIYIAGCAGRPMADSGEENAATSPAVSGTSQVFGQVSDTLAKNTASVVIKNLGSFQFDPDQVKTVRPDIFKPGYFSIFDVLVHLSETGQIDLEYIFDDSMNTHVIENLNGHGNWWYSAYYDGGWTESSVFRIDHYPYKDKMTLNFTEVTAEYLEEVFETYRLEVQRRAENDGRVVIPEIIIKGKTENLVFENFEVVAHNLRSDMFQPGVITAIDAILSLGEAGLISYDLQWYESIGSAGVVKSYWVERIGEDQSVGRCGFVYEAGDERFRFFRGNHNHIPSDIRVINAPAYLEYFWICI